MKSKFKLTFLSILISSLFSINAHSAIQGYKDKEEVVEKEESDFWFFKGYKTEEQKEKEQKEKSNKDKESLIKGYKKQETNVAIEEESSLPENNTIIQSELLVNVDGFVNNQVKTVENVKLIRPTTATHVVSENDTLWSLSIKYYNDGNKWNKILESNPSITNPTKLIAVQLLVIPEINSNFSDKQYTQININPYLLNHILHDVIILQEDHEFDRNKIITSENQQKLIKLTDKFYVPKEGISINEIYNVYRYNKAIKGLGQEYVQVGEAVSTDYIDELSLMKTVKVKDYLIKDDILIKKEVDIRESFNRISDTKISTTGKVLSIVNNKKNATLFDLIVLDLTNEIVDTGSVMVIYSQPFTVVDEDRGIESIVPSKELAEVIVVKAESNFSLGIISKSIDDVNVGDTIR